MYMYKYMYMYVLLLLLYMYHSNCLRTLLPCYDVYVGAGAALHVQVSNYGVPCTCTCRMNSPKHGVLKPTRNADFYSIHVLVLSLLICSNPICSCCLWWFCRILTRSKCKVNFPCFKKHWCSHRYTTFFVIANQTINLPGDANICLKYI